MIAREISERVHCIATIDWDARMFDALVPLPDGTSYNAYVVRGSEATVLIDSSDEPYAQDFLARLEQLGPIDYVVSNHAEQDHSAAIPAVLERYPEATLLCSLKAKRILTDLLDLPAERIRTVKNNETLSLGDRTLQFVSTPWVHWPETMSTFLVEDRILFSCDLFGTHLATSDLFAVKDGLLMESAKRYYAEIMMPYATHVMNAIETVAPLNAAMIAPSHGPVHDDPEFIVSLYRAWAGDPPKNRVTVAYVSMHNSTRRMVDRLIDALMERGIGTDRFDLTVTDSGKLAMALVDAGTIVIASPTVLEAPHPLAANAAFIANVLKPKARYLAALGSYNWNSKALTKMESLLSDLEAEWLNPVLGRGLPTGDTNALIDVLADTIAEKHKADGLV